MKIAYFTYPSAFQNVGGGEIQLLKTREYVERAGIRADFFDMWHSRVENYDVLHVFSSVPECAGLMRAARSRQVKVVTSSVLWSDFKTHPARFALKWVYPAFPSGRREVLNLSDLILPNSEAEKSQIARLFAIPKEKIRVVHNAVDTEFASADPALFRARHGSQPFLLSVGRIEPRKNQLNLIRAVKKIGASRLVLIGSPVTGYEDYYAECRKEGEGFTTFLETLSHTDSLLKSAYAACDLFILQGWFETPGLAALEAGLAGARVLSTSGGSTKEYFGEHALYLDPSSPEDISKKIIAALQKPKDTALRDHIAERYTWERTAQETIAAYKEVLGHA